MFYPGEHIKKKIEVDPDNINHQMEYSGPEGFKGKFVRTEFQEHKWFLKTETTSISTTVAEVHSKAFRAHFSTSLRRLYLEA